MFEDLKVLMVNELGVFSDDVTPEAVLDRDLGIKPIDLVRLLLLIEEEYEIRLNEDIMLASETVGEISDYLECLVS